jgi:hypothetical protein
MFPRLHEAKLLLISSTGFFIDAYDLSVSVPDRTLSTH